MYKPYRLYLIILLILFIVFINLYNNKTIINEKFDNNYPDLFYINLKHRQDRRKHIEGELKKIDYPTNKITRIDATKHESGGTGCGLSHIKALKKGLKSPDDYVIILEDDFTWKYDKEKVKSILNKCQNFKEDWNVILLSKNGYSKKYNDYLEKVIDSQTASGYIIKKTYIPTLLKLWEKNMNIRLKYNISRERSNNGYTDHDTAIDICWKKLQHDKWYVTKPVLGFQMESYSDIENGMVNYELFTNY